MGTNPALIAHPGPPMLRLLSSIQIEESTLHSIAFLIGFRRRLMKLPGNAYALRHGEEVGDVKVLDRVLGPVTAFAIFVEMEVGQEHPITSIVRVATILIPFHHGGAQDP